MSDVYQPRRIQRLPTILARQIAAGEVIERPASVVKELLENSLDAGAKTINIDIQKGGRRLIKIEDDGHGIHCDDLHLAIDQHATSKLSCQEELMNIATLGFRGEALSSIAAASRFSLASRISSDEHGWQLEVIPNQEQIDKKPIAMLPGTSVKVSDIFFNIPARRKFLRTDNTEFRYIHETLRHIALSRHTIALNLQHNGVKILHCNADTDISQRVRSICGESFYSASWPLDFKHKKIHLSGWFGHPETASNQTDKQYFFLNGRIIRDRRISHAVRMACQEHIHPGKHPVYVLFLEIDANMVDVNVHPTKKEVRFRDSRDIHDFIYASIAKVIDSESPTQIETYIAPQSKSATQNISESAHPTLLQSTSGYVRSPTPHTTSYKIDSNTATATHEYLYIDNGHYIVATIDSALFLIDTLTAREAIVHHRLKQQFKVQNIRSRPLLVPLTVAISEQEVALAIDNKDALAQYGISVECVAPNKLLIKELPTLLEFANATTLLQDVIALLKLSWTTDKMLSTLAKHVNDASTIPLSNKESNTLFNDIKQLQEEYIGGKAWRRITSSMLQDLIKTPKK